MKKKILSFLLCAAIISAQSTLCFGQDADDFDAAEAIAETMVEADPDAELLQEDVQSCDEDEAVLAADTSITADGSSDITISGDVWSKFSSSNATVSMNDGILSFTPSTEKANVSNRNISFDMKNYEKAVIRMKYTDVSTPTTSAKKIDGYYAPFARITFRTVSSTGSIANTNADITYCTGNSNQVYSSDEFVEAEVNFSEISGYNLLSVSSMTIYPMYGFKSGNVQLESLVIKKSESSTPESGDIVIDFSNGSTYFNTMGPNGAVTLSIADDALHYVSKLVNGSSGYITKSNINIDGAKYNRFMMRAKVSNAGIDLQKRTPGFQIYWQGNDKSTGEEYTTAETRAYRVEYTNLTESGGLYSHSDYQDIVVDLSTISKWSDSNINMFRLDLLKNGEGTVDVKYMKLYYEEPGTDPDPGPDPGPDPDPNPAAENEEWFSIDFDSDVAGFVANSKSQITLSQENGCMKYVSHMTESDGKKASGWITKPVDLDGGKYYKLFIRMKIESAEKPFTASIPFLQLYYSGTDANGNKQNPSGSFTCSMDYKCDSVENEDGTTTYSSDWIVCEIDLSALKGWNTMRKITEIRFDIFKNGNGTAYVDYIRYLALPAVSSIGCDGKTDVDSQKIPVDSKNIDAYISQSVESVDKTCVNIYDEDGVNVGLKSVSYDKASNKITAQIDGELLSNTEYSFEINTNTKANSEQNLYKSIVGKFKTDRSAFEVDIKASGSSSAAVTIINSGAERKVLAVATAWDGDKYIGKVIVPVTAKADGTTEAEVNYSTLGGSRIEMVLWDFSAEKPIALGKNVFVSER